MSLDESVTATDHDVATPADPHEGEEGRRSHSLLTGSDRRTLTLMTAVPSFLHIALVWIPAIGTFILSFTNWNGVKWSSLKWVGFRNYKQLFTVFEKDLYESLFNNLWVMVALFVIGTPLGMLIAYILDRNLKARRSTRASSTPRWCCRSRSWASSGRASSIRRGRAF